MDLYHLLETKLARARSSMKSGKTGGLDLSEMDIGRIPLEVFQLTNLDTLYLNDNELETLPPEIGNLVNLEVLDLSRNNLSELPAEIGRLRNLKSLKLPGNCLRMLPPEIGNLSNLEILDVSYHLQPAHRIDGDAMVLLDSNQLADLPGEIGNLLNLRVLDLSYNFLTELPAEIGGLRNLRSLKLTGNQLTSLPPEIGKLVGLETLDVGYDYEVNKSDNIYRKGNQLSSLPKEIGNLAKLQSLDIRRNKIASLPPEIGNLANLEVLQLGYNNALLTVPSTIGNLTNLKSLYLEQNKLTRVPSEIGQLVQLTQLDLTHNNLETLPSEIGQLSNLKSLSLEYNKLVALPPEIGQLKNLRTLHLKNNQLTALPLEIGNLTNLESLSLLENQLTKLPETIAEVKNLRGLFLHSDQLLPLPATRFREWDVFISHAREDAESVALPLANALVKAGVKVWIDKRELQVGDSIRSKIDLGLSKSRFGIVILSQRFIDKTWTQRELNGLLALEDQGEKVILPVWHNISKATLAQFSPMLSDRLAANTAEGISVVASKIIDVVLYQANTSPSPLLPNLTRRFVELIREPDSALTNLRDFLVQHPRIIAQAFGQWEGTLTDVHAGSFNDYPAAFGTYEISATGEKIKYGLRLILTSPHTSLLSDTQMDQEDSLVRELMNVRRAEEMRRREEGSELSRTVIVSGRRQELSESETDLIGKFNVGVRALDISLRTYDLLIDACVSVDQQDWKR